MSTEWKQGTTLKTLSGDGWVTRLYRGSELRAEIHNFATRDKQVAIRDAAQMLERLKQEEER